MWFVAGAVAGFVIASLLTHSTESDALVAKGVRDKVAGVSPTAATIGDALGVWPYTVGLAGATQ
jgi:hypothetical protein